jgi:iron complex transport system substrate-binding protein
VIASVPYQLEAVGEILKSGVPFLGLAPHTLEDVYKDFAMIARLIGEERRGAEAIAQMQEEIEAIRKRASSAKSRPLVYCEEWGKPLIHSQQWVAELVEAAGGEFLGIPGAHTEAAQVMQAAPEILIMAWCGAGDRVPLSKVVEQRGWSEMQAVKSKDVFCIPDEFLNTPAPTLVEGLKALAGIIHPELFPVHPRVKRL